MNAQTVHCCSHRPLQSGRFATQSMASPVSTARPQALSSMRSSVFSSKSCLLQQRSQPQNSNRRQQVATQAGLFGLGFPEIAVITGVAALIFGPSKLPELGKELGKSVKSFQSAAKEFENELKDQTKDDESKAVEDKK